MKHERRSFLKLVSSMALTPAMVGVSRWNRLFCNMLPNGEAAKPVATVNKYNSNIRGVHGDLTLFTHHGVTDAEYIMYAHRFHTRFDPSVEIVVDNNAEVYYQYKKIADADRVTYSADVDRVTGWIYKLQTAILSEINERIAVTAARGEWKRGCAQELSIGRDTMFMLVDKVLKGGKKLSKKARLVSLWFHSACEEVAARMSDYEGLA